MHKAPSMSNPDKQIVDLIKKHHVLTLATCVDNRPWCASCFYAWLSSENAFVFTTDKSTLHGKQAILNENVAANIYLETKVIGKIRGLQVAGSLEQPTGELLEKVRKRYLKRFPYARLMETTMWILYPTTLKLTDNRLGFGKKLIWEKNESSK
ncbi:MAG: pyridoxamine 5'-phosphate oxidase family protein [Salinivirgaceae bacterium]